MIQRIGGQDEMPGWPEDVRAQDRAVGKQGVQVGLARIALKPLREGPLGERIFL
jgi:hypothetical protein